MRLLSRNTVLALGLAAGLAPLALFAAPPAQAMKAMSGKSYTGTVTDAMCGASHADMAKGASDAACTKVCVKGGSDYALVVGKDAYTLKTMSKRQRAELSKFAGEKVTVSGTLDGTTLTVRKIAPAMGM